MCDVITPTVIRSVRASNALSIQLAVSPSIFSLRRPSAINLSSTFALAVSVFTARCYAMRGSVVARRLSDCPSVCL